MFLYRSAVGRSGSETRNGEGIDALASLSQCRARMPVSSSARWSWCFFSFFLFGNIKKEACDLLRTKDLQLMRKGMKSLVCNRTRAFSKNQIHLCAPMLWWFSHKKQNEVLTIEKGIVLSRFSWSPHHNMLISMLISRLWISRNMDFTWIIPLDSPLD